MLLQSLDPAMEEVAVSALGRGSLGRWWFSGAATAFSDGGAQDQPRPSPTVALGPRRALRRRL